MVRLLFQNSLLASALALSVSAQDIGSPDKAVASSPAPDVNLSTCVITCFDSATRYVGCGQTDSDCLCSKSSDLTATYRPCLISKCLLPAADANDFSDAITQICSTLKHHDSLSVQSTSIGSTTSSISASLATYLPLVTSSILRESVSTTKVITTTNSGPSTSESSTSVSFSSATESPSDISSSAISTATILDSKSSASTSVAPILSAFSSLPSVSAILSILASDFQSPFNTLSASRRAWQTRSARAIYSPRVTSATDGDVTPNGYAITNSVAEPSTTEAVASASSASGGTISFSEPLPSASLPTGYTGSGVSGTTIQSASTLSPTGSEHAPLIRSNEEQPAYRNATIANSTAGPNTVVNHSTLTYPIPASTGYGNNSLIGNAVPIAVSNTAVAMNVARHVVYMGGLEVVFLIFRWFA